MRDQYVMEVAGAPRWRRAAPGDAGGPRAAPRAGEARAHAQPPERCAAPSARAPEKDGPELEVLRHVVHGWADVEHWIRYEDLFLSDLHTMAFRALMAHPTVHEAIEAAGPGVGELLARLAVEESSPRRSTRWCGCSRGGPPRGTGGARGRGCDADPVLQKVSDGSS